MSEVPMQSMQDHMGIEFLELSSNKAMARMKVSTATIQPFGFVNGGALLAMAEILSGAASTYILPDDKVALGSSVHANHINTAPLDSVILAVATLVHQGSIHHIWDVKIYNSDKRIISTLQITNTIVSKAALQKKFAKTNAAAARYIENFDKNKLLTSSQPTAAEAQSFDDTTVADDMPFTLSDNSDPFDMSNSPVREAQTAETVTHAQSTDTAKDESDYSLKDENELAPDAEDLKDANVAIPETLVKYQSSIDRYKADVIFNSLLNHSTHKSYYDNIAMSTIKMLVHNSRVPESTLELMPSSAKFSPFNIQHPIKEFNLVDQDPEFKKRFKRVMNRYLKKRGDLERKAQDSKRDYSASKVPFDFKKELDALNLLYSQLFLDLIRLHIHEKSPAIDRLCKILNLVRNNELSQRINKSNEVRVFNIGFAVDVLNLLYKNFAIFPLKESGELCLIVSNPSHVRHDCTLENLAGQSGFIFFPFCANRNNENVFFKVDNNVIIGKDNIINFAINLLFNVYSRMLLHASLNSLPDLKKTCNLVLYMIYIQRHNSEAIKRNYDIYSFYRYIKMSMPEFFTDGADFIKEELSKDIYRHAFDRASTFIRKNECRKLVLSRRNDFEFEKSVGSVFDACLGKYKDTAFTYLIKNDVKGIWIGASPEILASFNNNVLSTVSLAGTMPVIEDLSLAKWSEKNQKEQQLVTDYIEDVVKKYTTSYHKSDVYTAKAGPVMHLKTDFKAHVGNLHTALSLARELNPTPAVCGLPKDEVKAFLVENEGYDREYYSGMVGYINNSEFSFYVNLRCMRIIKQTASLYVGGGVLPESNFEDEFDETCHKLETMKTLLKNK